MIGQLTVHRFLQSSNIVSWCFFINPMLLSSVYIYTMILNTFLHTSFVYYFPLVCVNRLLVTMATTSQRWGGPTRMSCESRDCTEISPYQLAPLPTDSWLHIHVCTKPRLGWQGHRKFLCTKNALSWILKSWSFLHLQFIPF